MRPFRPPSVPCGRFHHDPLVLIKKLRHREDKFLVHVTVFESRFGASVPALHSCTKMPLPSRKLERSGEPADIAPLLRTGSPESSPRTQGNRAGRGQGPEDVAGPGASAARVFETHEPGHLFCWSHTELDFHSPETITSLGEALHPGGGRGRGRPVAPGPQKEASAWTASGGSAVATGLLMAPVPVAKSPLTPRRARGLNQAPESPRTLPALIRGFQPC